MKYPLFPFIIIKYSLFCLVIFAISPAKTYAQEFDCTVEINIDQLEGSSFNYLANLKEVLENYINEYKWTDQEFEEEERIVCQIQVAVTSGNNDQVFGAEVVFQLQRPIYASTAKTTTVLLNDGAWQFSYQEGKTLIHDELQFEELTGFIDFFCYIMLGYDFDTFADLGGEPYFKKAQDILNRAQTTSAIGWSRNANNGRNRNTLVNDLISNNYKPLRTAYYRYHRLGLDQFVANSEKARQEILGALKDIQEAKRRTTSNYLYDIFFDAKYREITALFMEAETDLRLEAYEVLRQTDQGHLTDYERLQN